MKRFLFLFPFSFFLFPFLSLPFGEGWGGAFSQGYVTLQGRQFKLNGSDFYPVVMNFGVEIIQNTTTNKGYISAVGYFGEDDTGYEFYGDPDESQEKYNEQLRAGFTKCLDMGFNCIRVGIAPEYIVNGKINPYDLSPDAPLADVKDPDNNYSTVNNYTGFAYPLLWWPVWYKQYMKLNSTYDPVEDIGVKDLFGFIDIVLEQAEAVGIKVILITGGGNLWYNSTSVDAYAAYLTALADHLKNNTALFAYDLINEPGDQTKANMNASLTKQDVCAITRQWYDAIKASDPNHLVTIGGGTDLDAMLWDPALMKADFLSPHIYPDELAYEKTGDASGYSRADAFERWKARVYWISRNSPLPWLIGETGFSALDDIPGFDEQNIYNRPPYMWGTEAEQAAFARNSQQYVWDCGGSGYSWWIVQDYIRNLIRCDGVNCSPVIITCPDGCTPVYNYTNLPDDVSGKPAYQNYWGLIYSNKDFDETSGIDKPSVNEFKNFKPQLLPPNPPTGPPSNYYNPNHHPASANTVGGIVKDQDGNPIEGAVIVGHSWLETIDPDETPNSGDEEYGNHAHATFTNASGNFQIIPYNYIDPSDNRLIHIYASAPGSGSRYEAGGWEDVQMSVSAGTINFNTNKLTFDALVTNKTVAAGNTENFKGWNSVTLSNTIINGSSEITASQEINLQSEFHAGYGSEVHIFTSDIIDCNAVERKGNTSKHKDEDSGAEEADESPHEIQLSFKPSENGINEFLLDVSIVPNPNKGIFTVRINDELRIKQISLKIKNIIGEVLREYRIEGNEIVIDARAISKGIYFIELSSSDNAVTVTKKLIIN